MTEQHAHDIVDGPALLFTSLIPDMDHHSGRGGRVMPLYRDATRTVPNVTPGLLKFLRRTFSVEVDPEDLIAYMAAVTSHPAYTRQHARDLREPGVRLPITAEPRLWRDAVLLGQEVVRLQTHWPRVGHNLGIERGAAGDGPLVQVGIPDTEDGMPERIWYDDEARTLHVGVGEIAPVSQEVWDYRVNGMQVVKHWFGYRRKRPAGRRSSPLDDIVATTWTPEMTSELLSLLSTLQQCVDLEPEQAELLAAILAGPMVTIDDLTAAGVLPVPAYASRPPKANVENVLFDE